MKTLYIFRGKIFGHPDLISDRTVGFNSAYFRYLILFVYALSLYSCEKEDIHDEPLSILIMGEVDDKRLTTQWYELDLVVGTTETESDSIDLFQDKHYDFYFRTSWWKWARKHRNTVTCLNDSLEILVDMIDDTLYLSYNNQNPEIPEDWDGNKYIVLYNSLSEFDSFCEEDSIESAYTIHTPVMFSRGDTVDLTKESLLWYNSAIFSFYSEGVNGTYIIYERTRFEGWNNSEYKYFCFRIKRQDGYRYGWVKLRNNWLGSLTVEESAVSN